jgi:hypothetical protein
MLISEHRTPAKLTDIHDVTSSPLGLSEPRLTLAECASGRLSTSAAKRADLRIFINVW